MSTRTELVNDYIASIRAANNEAAKKEIFISLLTSLFGSQDDFGIISQFTSGAERRITNISRIGFSSKNRRLFGEPSYPRTRYGLMCLRR